MGFEENLNNIKLMFSEIKYILIAIVSSLIIGTFMFYFTNYNLIKGNMGVFYANFHVLLQSLIIILFGINISLLFYQLETTSKFNSRTTGATSFGSIVSVIVSGCPSCGITLASYLGLTSIFSWLPFYGMEIKLIGISLLLYSTYSISKNLNNCEI